MNTRAHTTFVLFLFEFEGDGERGAKGKLGGAGGRERRGPGCQVNDCLAPDFGGALTEIESPIPAFFVI
jgi:hypothetical protein